MDRISATTWAKTLTLPDGQAIQYKYTRGNWNVVEWWGPIVSVFNRQATVNYGSNGTQIISDTVPYWRDPLVIDHEPAGGAAGVEPSAVLSATLSRYLDPVSIASDNLLLRSETSTPTLEIGFYHHTAITATTIAMTPTAMLQEATLYTMTLGTGLKGTQADNEGIALQRPYAWQFWTIGPDLTGSYKLVAPVGAVNSGELLTYTVFLSNSGALDARVAIADTLPPELLLVSGFEGGGLTWTGAVTAGEEMSLTLVARVDPGLAANTTVSNVVTIADGFQPPFDVASPETMVLVPDLSLWCYLPLIFKGH
jgi:uncharacterized repeat protein (TIGR01451 family)